VGHVFHPGVVALSLHAEGTSIMQVQQSNETQNPLGELISDDLYEVLESNNLLSDKGIRDFKLRKKFRDLREENIPAYDAIELLREEYPYLQFDTIRKIVYKLSTRS
jgi:hypothetical protein